MKDKLVNIWSKMKITEFIKKLFRKTYTFDTWRLILRDKGYVPMGNLTIEDELREVCKENRWVYLSIIPKDAYEIIYCDVKTEEEREKLQKIIDEQGDVLKEIR